MIFAADDYLYKTLVDLTGISATAKKSDVIEAPNAPYVSSYGDGAPIKSAFHPFNGGQLHCTARVLNVLPKSTDAGNFSLKLYTNEWNSTSGAMGTDCDRLVATYGPFDAKDIIFDDGLALDMILPENLGTKIQFQLTGTAFTAVSSESPTLEVMVEEYSTVNG